MSKQRAEALLCSTDFTVTIGSFESSDIRGVKLYKLLLCLRLNFIGDKYVCILFFVGLDEKKKTEGERGILKTRDKGTK